MSDPINSDYPYSICWYCDRDPTSNETMILLDTPTLYQTWVNTVTNEQWFCYDNTSNAQIWKRIVHGDLNRTRAYSAVSSPAFDTARQPNVVRDVHVNAGVTLTSVSLGSAIVTPQVSVDNSTWVSLAPVGISGAVSDQKFAINFTVPASYYYQLVSANSGVGSSATLDSIVELTD